MRAFDRDLIRGRHYGQRSCGPHSKAEHMAAPTTAATCEKPLTARSRSLIATAKASAKFSDRAKDLRNLSFEVISLVRPRRRLSLAPTARSRRWAEVAFVGLLALNILVMARRGRPPFAPPQ